MITFLSSLQPKDYSTKIWRYLDLTKFLSILDSESLFFPRADKLEDVFEGTFPKQFIRKKRQQLEKYNKFSKYKITSLIDYDDLNKKIAISCWHMNNQESVAMWKTYLKSNEGIAIQTTPEKLKQSIISKEKIIIGKVNYIDYNKDTIEQNSISSSFFYKRKSFEHENEIRAIIDKFSTFREIKGSGININVDVNKLIEKIYVAPTCEKWVLKLIRSLIKKYNYNFLVTQSKLDKKPFH